MMLDDDDFPSLVKEKPRQSSKASRQSSTTMHSKRETKLIAERDELLLKNTTFAESNKALSLANATLSETKMVLLKEQHVLQEAHTDLIAKNKKLRTELLNKSSTLIRDELEVAVTAAGAAQQQTTLLSGANAQLRHELDTAVARNTGLRLQLENTLPKTPPRSTDTNATSKGFDARRYSSKPTPEEDTALFRSNASVGDQLIKEDLLHANEILAIANRELMVKNEQYAKHAMDLEFTVGSGDVTVLGDGSFGKKVNPSKLAQENRMLQARVEMQAQLNTTLSIECEELLEQMAAMRGTLNSQRD